MQKTTSPSRGQRWRIALLLLASLVVVAAEKIFDYSAAPAKEKESDFVYPPNADQTKPTTLVLQVPPSQQLPFEQVGGYINDASHLNKTAVYGIVRITTVQDIENALRFAREHKLKVTAAGSRHSMGGHTFVKDGLVLDMRGFNHVRLDKEHKILNVQTGATWKQLQLFLAQCECARDRARSWASGADGSFVSHPAEQRRNQELQHKGELRIVSSRAWRVRIDGHHSRRGLGCRRKRDVHLENALHGLQGFRQLLQEKCRRQSRHWPRLRAAFDVTRDFPERNGNSHV